MRRDEAGTSAVEFALLAPVLCVMAAGTIDMTTLIVRSMEVRASAQAGADFALANGWNETGIASAVTSATHTQAVVSASPAPTLTNGCIVGQAIAPAAGAQCPGGGAPGRYVTVAAQAPFDPIMAWPGMIVPRNLSAQAVVRIP